MARITTSAEHDNALHRVLVESIADEPTVEPELAEVRLLPVADLSGRLIGDQPDRPAVPGHPFDRAFNRRRDTGIRVGEVMSSPPGTIESIATVRDAAYRMVEEHLPGWWPSKFTDGRLASSRPWTTSPSPPKLNQKGEDR